jgi:hypothetical protein
MMDETSFVCSQTADVLTEGSLTKIIRCAISARHLSTWWEGCRDHSAGVAPRCGTVITPTEDLDSKYAISLASFCRRQQNMPVESTFLAFLSDRFFLL